MLRFFLIERVSWPNVVCGALARRLPSGVFGPVL